MFLFKSKKEIVGVDIGSSSIKVVQIKVLKDSYSLVNIGIFPLPPEAIVDNTLMDSSAISLAIKNVFESLRIKIKDAACSISGNSVIIRKIVLPAMPQEELEDQISWEAEQYIPFDINDVNMDFQILSPDSIDPSKMNVLLVASKKDIINDYVSVFTDAGLNLSVVDIDSFAVQNAFELNHDILNDSVLALVNIGASIMNINVIKDGITLFTRDVQIGGNHYTEEIQKQLGLTWSEAENSKKIISKDGDDSVIRVLSKVNESIALEIRRSLDFYNSTANEERISSIFCSGGASKSFGLLEEISAKIGLPVECINPFAKLKYSDKEFDSEYLQEIGALMAVSVGLAIRRLGDK